MPADNIGFSILYEIPFTTVLLVINLKLILLIGVWKFVKQNLQKMIYKIQGFLTDTQAHVTLQVVSVN